VPVAEVATGPVRLTRREREIAALAASGVPSRQIAEQLFLSPRTVESHLHNAFVKLGVSDRAALAAALVPTPTSK
jgi:DNA-binding CsgD family transcriptional regulator